MYARKAQRSRGFTLIEVLVVVAIIALLISILLPSLSQARELARLTVCQTHQKNVGNGIQMYFNDNNESMPGPIHPMFLAHPETLGDLNGDGKVETVEEKFVANGYINTRLRKYMGDKTYGKGQNMKDVGQCPSFPIKDPQFAAAGIPVYHYAINSSNLTAPWLYFGFTHAGIGSPSAWYNAYDGGDAAKRNHYSPKKLAKIFAGPGPNGSNWKFSPSTEWMVADAFRRPLRAGQCGVWPTENEPGNEAFSDIPSPVWSQGPKEWGSLSDTVHGSGQSASAKVSPYHPYHIGGGYKKSNGVATFTGKVATLYFDMHVAAQEGWKGTVFQRNLLQAANCTTLRD
jgi:prepilin-type N-terminal cleavage/methylation domain-containing protein